MNSSISQVLIPPPAHPSIHRGKVQRFLFNDLADAEWEALAAGVFGIVEQADGAVPIPATGEEGWPSPAGAFLGALAQHRGERPSSGLKDAWQHVRETQPELFWNGIVALTQE